MEAPDRTLYLDGRTQATAMRPCLPSPPKGLQAYYTLFILLILLSGDHAAHGGLQDNRSLRRLQQVPRLLASPGRLQDDRRVLHLQVALPLDEASRNRLNTNSRFHTKKEKELVLWVRP